MRERYALAGAAALLAATQAVAHEGAGAVGGLIAGVEHPLTGGDHLLAMISVGIWGAVLGRPLLIALPVVFPAMMAVGGVLGIVAIAFPPIEVGIALSVLALGTAIAFTWRAPVWTAVLMVGTFALFHGYAHGRELPQAADPVAYSIGFMAATGMLHLAGIGIGQVYGTPAGRMIVRALGASVTGFGVFFLIRAAV